MTNLDARTQRNKGLGVALVLSGIARAKQTASGLLSGGGNLPCRDLEVPPVSSCSAFEAPLVTSPALSMRLSWAAVTEVVNPSTGDVTESATSAGGVGGSGGAGGWTFRSSAAFPASCAVQTL